MKRKLQSLFKLVIKLKVASQRPFIILENLIIKMVDQAECLGYYPFLKKDKAKSFFFFLL